MLLDIIVPHNTESWDVVRPFFNMINSQKCVDFSEFRIILIHDGVSKFPDSYFEGPATVIQLEQEKKGVSAARNLGMDYSEAEWINFSDCDDCYSSILSLYKIFSVLRKENRYDLLWSPFYMLMNGSAFVFEKYNPIFIHNKYYRLSFLRETGIRFCEKLYMSEDSAFNMVLSTHMSQDKIGEIDSQEPLYSWCRRKGSITMDHEKWISNVEGHFDRNLYVLSECKKNAEKLKPELMVGRIITDAYAMLTKQGITGDQKHIRKRIADFYRENKDVLLRISGIDLNGMLNLSDTEVGNSEEVRKSRKPIHLWLCELENENQ